jgi:hypothetical protein
VSSTFTDLQEHRHALRNALQSLQDVEYVGPEYLSARAEPPLETSRREIGESAALVLLIGWRYGYIPEGQQKSIVELEYEAALAHRVSVLPYVIDDNYPVPAKFIETGESAESLRRFKERVRKEKVIKTFTSPEDLARQVAIDIAYSGKRSISEAPEDIIARPHLENQLRRCRETSSAYESTINALRNRLDDLVPAVPIWTRRNFVVDTTLCFALMPFQDDFFLVYEDGILRQLSP